MHVNDDWVLLEPIDAQGRPVPPGQPSWSEHGLPHAHLHFDPALPAVEPRSGKLRQVIAQVRG